MIAHLPEPPVDRSFDVVIVGAGHAGAQAAISLRQLGFEGSIAIIGAEDEAPYERPPLSKDYLAGDKSFDRLLIRPPTFWEERRITLLLGRPVGAVDAARRFVVVDGTAIGYGDLIWAAGGTPRSLTCAGSDATNIHAIRRRTDVDAIVARLGTAARVCVVGGGYIGLEAAAVLTKLGKQVVLLEAFDRVLARVAGVELSRFFEAEHRSHGVDLRTGSTVSAFETKGGDATAVVTDDGERVSTDMVIVGIGIVPETGPLLDAGAVGRDGVDVDELCRTSLPNVYAVGDCARHANAFAHGERIRVESVQNATDQAKTAAHAIVGRPEPYATVPWFWSNQYDLRLQTVGLSLGHDQTVVRGDPASRSFSVLYLRAGTLIAADCVNAVKDYVEARSPIEHALTPDPAQLAASAIPLKEIAARPQSSYSRTNRSMFQ